MTYNVYGGMLNLTKPLLFYHWLSYLICFNADVENQY